jgi:hypothetical protein
MNSFDLDMLRPKLSHARQLRASTCLKKLVVFTSVIRLLLWGDVSRSDAGQVLYTATGTLEYKSKVFKIQDQVAFTISVSNCVWSIKGSSSSAPDTVFKQVYNGDFVTSATRFPDSVRKLSGSGNDAAVGIEQHDTPNSLPPIAAGVIWLAYGSGCKFAGTNDGLLEIIWPVDQELVRDRFRTTAKSVLLLEPPFLPSTVDYYFDADLFKKAQPQASGKSGTNKDLPWATYRAMTFTNLGALRLPKVFQLVVYSTSDFKVMSSYQGELTNVYAGVDKDAFDRGYGTTSLVQDERFISKSNPVSYVRYFATNDAVPATNDPAMIDAAIRAKLSQKLSPMPTVPTFNEKLYVILKRSLLFLLVSSIALIPFFLAWRRE